jgi:O-antigen biosynthesis protein
MRGEVAGAEERPVSDSVPVSVVIPTVGRPRLLAQCLESLARCRPRAAEVLVVDQSGERAVAELVERFSGIGARLVSLPRPNLSWARNVGMQQASEEVVLFIDDDCTVAEDWAGAAWHLMSADPDRIVTGRVIGTSPDVPSVREDEERHDHTGEHRCEILYPNNMGARRTHLLEFGGFDERFKGAGEDLDLCYRWLRAGRRLWFEPELVVWHHDWRAPGELSLLYDRYWREQAVFYGKHLRRADLGILWFVARDAAYGLLALLQAVARREPLGRPARRLRILIAGIAREVVRPRAAPTRREADST